MLKKRLIIIIILLLTFISIGFLLFTYTQTFTSKNTTPKPKIAVTIFPIYDIARNIGGDKIDFVQILPSGTSPHTYEPTIQDQEKLQGSRILFMAGLGIDDWSTKLLADQSIEEVTLYNSIDLIKITYHNEEINFQNVCIENNGNWISQYSECEGIVKQTCEINNGVFNSCASPCRHQPDTVGCIQLCVSLCQFAGKNLNSSSYDPHYWNSILNAKIIANSILGKLAEIDPQNKNYYETNYENYINELDGAYSKALVKIADLDNKRIITFHDAFSYFANDLGLEVTTTIEPYPGKEATPAYLVDIGKIIQQYNIQVLYKEPQLSDSIITPLANDFGVKIYTLDPLGGTDTRLTFIDNFNYNVDTIVNSESS